MTYFPNRLTGSAMRYVPNRLIGWKPVTRHTRAASTGRFIKCPECGAIHRVYHFSWCALQCKSCNTMVDKTDWSYKQ